MIAYYLGASERVIDECQERGWVKIAYQRFAAGEQYGEKHDIRAIWRFSDLMPFPGKTNLIQGKEYDDGPDNATEEQLERWLKERDRFEAFVESGSAQWVKAP